MSISSITSSVSDIGSKLYGAASTIARDYQERNATLEQVFSNLDTEGKGYLDASDFEMAFEALGLGESAEEESDGSLTLPGVEDVVAALDMDGDGKISSDDLTEGMRSLTDSLSFLQGRAEMLGSEALTLAQTFGGQQTDEDGTQSAETTASAESVSAEQSRPDLFVMRRVMQLVNAYGASYRSNESSESLSLVA